MRRALGIADLHDGSVWGLTPPEFSFRWEPQSEQSELLLLRTEQERRVAWDWFAAKVNAIRPIDICFLVGDAIEGPATRQGGLELITPNPLEQIEIAKSVVRYVGAPINRMAYGTPYHTGDNTDFEKAIADAIGAKIGGEDTFLIEGNGKIVNIKHHISGSTIPHGRHTPLAREQMWNLLWAHRKEFPLADILLRAHVHYHVAASDADWLAMTLPALQLPGSRYGVRRCSRTVDFGFVYFDFEDDGSYTYHVELLKGKEAPWAQEADVL